MVQVRFSIHAVALALIPVAGLILLKVKFDDMPRLLWVIVIVLSVEILRSAFVAMRARSGGTLVNDIVRMSLIALIGMMFVAPRVAAWMTQPRSGRDAEQRRRAAAAVFVIDERIGSLIFYLDPPLRARGHRRSASTWRRFPTS